MKYQPHWTKVQKLSITRVGVGVGESSSTDQTRLLKHLAVNHLPSGQAHRQHSKQQQRFLFHLKQNSNSSGNQLTLQHLSSQRDQRIFTKLCSTLIVYLDLKRSLRNLSIKLG